MKVNQSELFVPGDVRQTLINCKGYYNRPPGGPLVGYAGTYEAGSPGEPRQYHYVGLEYFNCAKAEQYPLVRQLWADEYRKKWNWEIPDVILGAPMGGILFADSLATAFECRVVFAEKKVIKRAEISGQRDEAALILDRHEIEPGDRVVIGEDVCNNFSTTTELVKLILSCEAIPYAIACIVNRSGKINYQEDETIIPLSALANIPTKQFRQDDSEVCEAVESGNIVWKPKQREAWAKLMALMKLVNV